MRKIARIDSNQPEFVEYLRNKDYSVHITSQLGAGFPDIIVGAYGVICVLVEIKDPKKPLSKRALTDDEIKFKLNTKTPYIVALHPYEVVEFIEDLYKSFIKVI